MSRLDPRQRFADSLTRVEIRPQVVIVSGQQLSDIRLQTAKNLPLVFIQRLDGPEFAVQLLQIAAKFLMNNSFRLLLAHRLLCSGGCGDVGFSNPTTSSES